MKTDIATALRNLSRYGVVTREQLLLDGVPSNAIDRALRRGLLIRRHQGIYLVGACPDLWVARAHADVLYVDRQARRLMGDVPLGPTVALTGVGAAVLLDVPHLDRPTTPMVLSSHRSRVTNVATLWRPSFSPARRTVARGAAVSDLDWTVAELIHVLRASHATNVVADLLREGRTSFDALHDVADEMEEDGEWVTTFLGRLTREDVEARADTERRVVRACVRHGLPLPRVNHRIATPWRPIEGDLCWPDLRCNLEIDGPHHLMREQRRRDQARDSALDDIGWLVARVPASQVHDDLDGVIDTARNLLREASAQHHGDSGTQPRDMGAEVLATRHAAPGERG